MWDVITTHAMTSVLSKSKVHFVESRFILADNISEIELLLSLGMD